MEIKITARQMQNVLLVFSWIIFVGLSIEAAGIIVNTVYTMARTADGAKHLWKHIDLSNLYNHNPSHFFVQSVLIIIAMLLKAILFYCIIHFLHNKKLNLSQPFSPAAGRFIKIAAWLALGTGFFSYWGAKNALGLTATGIAMPGAEQLRLGGADVWLFMGITLLVIAQIFKRGIELQTENELTV